MGTHARRPSSIHVFSVLILLTGILLPGALVSCGASDQAAASPESSAPFPIAPMKIAHVMSYHSPWKWTDGQYEGFRSAFRNLPVEYRTWQMDAKRQPDPAVLEDTARTIREELAAWKPDLLYVTDDPALNQVASAFFGTTTPIVFSGVNSQPDNGVLMDFKNATGVLEKELFAESYRLLQSIVPGASRMAVIWDDDSQSWKGVIDNLMEARKLFPQLKLPFIGRVETMDELEDLILNQFPGKVDFICFIGIFGFRDASGAKVPYEEVMQWVAENSRIPDISFWEDRISHGTLCGVIVSALKQGQAAGGLARSMLVDHQSPDSLGIIQGTGGLPMINLKRAKALGLQIPSDILLNSTVLTEYDWDIYDHKVKK